ncbi:MAG: hypothetical protein JWR42_1628 [Marmoricola sp.]|nr:hypothetical protein [Marmoricola sp.]
MTTATRHLSGEEYDGPARIDDVELEVRLRGHFEPIDGRFHWWGRLARGTELPHTSGDTVTLTLPTGSAEGRLSDVDPWGRLRISGTGRPPF